MDSDGEVTPRIVSTTEISVADKVAYWADQVCRHLIAVECQSIGAPEDFEGEIRALTLADSTVSQIVSGAQRVARTHALMTKDTKEFFLLNIQRHGHGVVKQDGREARLVPGEMSLYSSARPYSLSFDSAFQQTVLVLPASDLRATMPEVDQLTAVTFGTNHPLAPLLIQMADNLFGLDHGALTRHAAWKVQNSLVEMLAASLSLLSPSKRLISDLSSFHLSRIKGYIAENISDPELSVVSLAAALRISTSHIHRLFVAEGITCNAWIWSRRLALCRQALASPVNRQYTVSQIAYQFGFNNASHFSRIFRSQFGLTPREWREQCLAL